jgi:hypothetical protein
MDLNEMYENDAAFRRYVDRYVVSNHTDLEMALTHRVVQNYAEYLKSRGESEIALANMWAGESAGAAHENVMTEVG